MRSKTIAEVKDRINFAIGSLSDINRLPADGLTIDAAALIHRQGIASIQRLDRFYKSMQLLDETATDF